MSYTNFTKVGNPTITDDGIASGFSSSNYINTIQLSGLANKSWGIEGAFEYVPVSTGNPLLLGLTPLYAVRGALYYNNTGSVMFGAYIGVTGDVTSEGAKITLSNILTTTGKYYYKLSFNLLTGKYTLSIYDSNKVLINGGEYTPPTTNKQLWDINNSPTTYISVSRTLSGGSNYSGSIDLNAFRIYIDGNLVYQPYSSDFRLINRIYNRHDTAANFATNNPILAAGEIAAETDTYNAKIGDGVSQYNAIPYLVNGDGISHIVALTQAEYDVLATKDANTFYVIVAANNS